MNQKEISRWLKDSPTYAVETGRPIRVCGLALHSAALKSSYELHLIEVKIPLLIDSAKYFGARLWLQPAIMKIPYNSNTIKNKIKV